MFNQWIMFATKNQTQNKVQLAINKNWKLKTGN
jgi:hypothetical protein